MITQSRAAPADGSILSSALPDNTSNPLITADTRDRHQRDVRSGEDREALSVPVGILLPVATEARKGDRMKIAVTTPTGHVGSRVHLLGSRDPPSSLVRDPTKLDTGHPHPVDVAQLTRATLDAVPGPPEDVDALFWSIRQARTPTRSPVCPMAAGARAVEQNRIARRCSS